MGLSVVGWGGRMGWGRPGDGNVDSSHFGGLQACLGPSGISGGPVLRSGLTGRARAGDGACGLKAWRFRDMMVPARLRVRPVAELTRKN